ncbi:hypothetical protein H5410_012267 [Solanum commersonii]|uniref:Uncharacterized protein n=1 Tax=Solanum commersonii TaxID=4109 RepID=A0A9J6ARX2_SOLCO|nr:hypothetical protein H5410_012267 [Solanum commersonii]
MESPLLENQSALSQCEISRLESRFSRDNMGWEKKNHAPLHVVCNTSQEHVMKPFRFLNFWTKHENFKKLIADVWQDGEITGNSFTVAQ